MKILLVTPEFPPTSGGVSRYLGVLAENNPSFVICAPGQQYDYPRGHWFRLIGTVLSIIEKEKPDVVLYSHVLPLGTVGLLLKRWVPYVILCHGMDVALPLARKGRKKWLAGMVLRNAYRVIANSEFTASMVAQYLVSGSHTTVVHPPFSWDPKNITPRLEEGSTPIITFVGRLVERKGILELLVAVASLREKIPQLVVEIAGEGTQRAIAEEKYTDASWIHWLGKVDDATVQDIYRRSWIVVLPVQEREGDVEGFGMSAADAGLFGIPALVTSVGGLAEAVRAGETGWVIPAHDENILRDTLLRILTDDVERKRRGQLARVAALKQSHDAFRAKFLRALSL